MAQDELVNIIYMAEPTQKLALHNNDKASRAYHCSTNCTVMKGIITKKKTQWFNVSLLNLILGKHKF